jgi:uncharacterized membrane protein HdeD (DUF308 family)
MIRYILIVFGPVPKIAHATPVVVGALAVLAIAVVSAQVDGSVVAAVSLAYLIGLWACLLGCARWRPARHPSRPRGRTRLFMGIAVYIAPLWILALFGLPSYVLVGLLGFGLGAGCFTVVQRADRQLAEWERGLADDLLG